MDNGVVSGRIIEGSASNGLKFKGYIGDDGLVTNFFFSVMIKEKGDLTMNELLEWMEYIEDVRQEKRYVIN